MINQLKVASPRTACNISGGKLLCGGVILLATRESNRQQKSADKSIKLLHIYLFSTGLMGRQAP
ncbi:hypothetical protein V0R37_12300 [Pollutimonas sp. H1-120]|uniref:hypothetical protein n=1 Tax=Pollutimonas sp. H1-120 TaxID=3148824 RepID=UPI003B526108